MKFAAVVLAAAGVFAAGTAQADAGEDLLKKSGCTACHSIEKKVVGPAYKDVAKKYAGNPAAEKMLAEKIVKGGKGVWGEIPMPPNVAVKPEEATKLAKWVLSLK